MSDRKTVHISLRLLSSSLLWLLKSFISSLVFFTTFLLRLWCLEICYTTSSIVTWSYSLSSIDFQFSFTSYDFRSTCSVFVVSYFLDLVCNLFTPLISFLTMWFSLGRINIHHEIRRSSQLRTLLKRAVVNRTWKNFRPVCYPLRSMKRIGSLKNNYLS